MELRDVFEDNIETIVDEKRLDDRLKESLSKGFVGGEQWFRNSVNWLMLTGFSNPYATVHSELEVLKQNRFVLERLTKEKLKIFYGLGSGDTEGLFCSWDLEKRHYTEVCGIDSTRTYLDIFVEQLKHLSYQFDPCKVKFKGYHALFEEIKPEHLQLRSSKLDSSVHIALGNVVGNFLDQDEIFSLFDRNMKLGEYLVLGVHLKGDPYILEKYNQLHLNKLVKDSVQFKLKDEINWIYNENEDRVEAWVGEVLALHSKKYDINQLSEYLQDKFGLTYVMRMRNMCSAICVFEKPKE